MRNNLTADKRGSVFKLAFKVSVNIPVIPFGRKILCNEEGVERIALSPDLSVCTLINER